MVVHTVAPVTWKVEAVGLWLKANLGKLAYDPIWKTK
jgi:hypothetical protein